MDPEAVISALAARDLSAKLLGITVVDVAAGSATVEMTVRPDMDNGHGVCHGGFLFTLADAAMGYASNSHNEQAMAVSADIDFVRPGRLHSILTASATETLLGRRNAVYDVTIVDDAGETVALFRGRVRRLGSPVLDREPPEAH